MVKPVAIGSATLHHGDCRKVLRSLTENSLDACVTDPPYHLTQVSRGGHARTNNPEMPHGRHRIGDKGFMGKQWDGGDVAFRPETWAEVFRVLKPGAHLLAFGGARTYHRLVCAIEDAGFEIRDQVMWVYGSGFPKSLDVSKTIDKAAGAEREIVGSKLGLPGYSDKANDTEEHGRMAFGKFTDAHAECAITAPATDAAKRWGGWGTALKPSHEPIVLARKPLVGTVAANVLEFGTGALNVDGCRIETDTPRPARSNELSASGLTGKGGTSTYGDYAVRGSVAVGETNLGRWPANLIHDGSEEVVALFPRGAGAAAPVHKRNADKFRNSYGTFAGNADEHGSTFQGDSGSAARFFYCAKTSSSERHEGMDHPGPQFEMGTTLRKVELAEKAGNTHPTVKPIALMRYLCRLITPPGGLILDPFAGSGSTGIAAIDEGFRFVGIEKEREYFDIACARLDAAQRQARLFT